MLADFHVHSTYSDGLAHPRYLGKLALKLGIKIIITDHDTAEGQAVLMKEVPDATIQGVYAMEKTHGAHILFRGQALYTHFNMFCPFPFGADEVPNSLQEAHAWAHENGCILQWNHPYYWFYKVTVLHPFEYMKEGFRHADMVELSNGNQTFFQDWFAYFALGGKPFLPGKYPDALTNLQGRLGKPLTSNTDAHFPWALGKNLNFVPDYVEDFDSFAEAVKGNAVHAYYAKRAPVCTKLAELSAWKGKPFLWLFKHFCGGTEAFVEYWNMRKFTGAL